MRVIAVQLDIAWENKPANHDRVRSLLDPARPPAGSLIVLPEMFATGFSMNVAATDEGDARPTERFMAELAGRFDAHLLGGVVRRAPDGRGLNQAVCFGRHGQELARYTKIHPFSFAEEDRHFARGGEVVTFDCGGFVAAPFVCYDLRFPEAFRAAVRRGAELLVVIANWPAAREDHWRTLLAARAIENQAYVVGVNRCGRDPKHAYQGASMIVDPRGKVVVEAGAGACTIGATLDRDALLEYRRQFPALADVSPRFASNPG